jgi:leucyl aminopeptidase
VREWAHIDIAGPSFREGRATGVGVALVVEVARRLSEGVSK